VPADSQGAGLQHSWCNAASCAHIPARDGKPSGRTWKVQSLRWVGTACVSTFAAPKRGAAACCRRERMDATQPAEEKVAWGCPGHYSPASAPKHNLSPKVMSY